MDVSFLKEQADGCRRLAENADQFTKRRLLDLAEKYDSRMSRPSRATRSRTRRPFRRRSLHFQSFPGEYLTRELLFP
jgi:hypothetical protein